MGGGGGDQKTTSTPWKGQQPYLEDIFRQAQGMFQQGPQQYYPGQQVAGFDPATQQGVNQLQQAGQPSAQQQGFGNWLSNTFSQGNIDPSAIANPAAGSTWGLGAGQNMLQQSGQPFGFGQAAGMAGVGGQPFSGPGGLGQALGFSGSPMPGAMPAANQFIGQSLQGGPQNLGQALGMAGGSVNPAATQQLQDTASGDYLGSNPYLDDVFKNAAGQATDAFNESVLPGLAAQFGSAGRTGSGAQALATGRAAGELSDSLRGLAGDIYAPAYEAERGRQQQAAGQLGQLGLGTGQLGSQFLQGQQQGAGLAGDLFSQGNAAEMQRLGLAGDMFNTGQQQDIARRGMASDLYSGGLDRQLAAGGQLANTGLQGLDVLSGLQGQLGQQAFQAGSLAPSFQQMGQQNIQNMLNAGAINEDQAQRLIDADMQKFNFGQQAPWQNLNQYANLINQLPGGYGQTSSSGGGGSRLSGAAGGAMAGSALGPWGTAGGALLGGLLGG